MDEVMSAIATVGFPIAACIFMARFITVDLKDLRSVVQSNTLVMQKILEHFKEEENHEK